MRNATAIAAAAGILVSGCSGEERGPVAGPELWRVPALGHSQSITASGDGAVYSVTSEDNAFMLTRFDETGTAWSLPLPDARTPFASATDGAVILVTGQVAADDTIDFRAQRIEPDGATDWDHPIARATGDAWAPAVVVAPDGMFVLLRVSTDATLDVGGVVITGDGQTCDEPAIPCEFTTLLHLSFDGEVVGRTRVQTPLFEITSTALVADRLIVAGYTEMFAFDVPPPDDEPIGPSWVVDTPEGLVMRLMAADSAGLYLKMWAGLGDDIQDSQATFLLFGLDGTQLLESDPLADSIDAIMPGTDGVTALVSDVVNGIASGSFLAAVDGDGQLMRREPLGERATIDATRDADGRLFLLGNVDIVARAPLP